jgi:alkylation response protein AidB-like acyl-CoA dehydrogenase
VRFAFTDEQLAMRDAVRAFLDKECPPKVVRDAWTNDTGRSGLWSRLGELGVLGVLAPETHGGFGGDYLDLVLLLEETGRAALPEPVVEHAAVAVPLLDDARVEAAAAGDVTITVAPPSGLVLDADTADLVLHGDRFVEPGTLQLRRHESVDGSRRLFGIAAPPTSIHLASLDRAALGVAAQLIGLADRMLTMTVEYAKERRQFGVPIGSFQAVKHMAVDMYVAIERARALCHFAGLTLAEDDDRRTLAASLAKAASGDCQRLVAKHGVQLFGGLGYTWENDLQIYMRRAKVGEPLLGSTADHRATAARLVLAGARPTEAK